MHTPHLRSVQKGHLTDWLKRCKVTFRNVVSRLTRVEYLVTWKTSLELSQVRMPKFGSMQEVHAVDMLNQV